jgi:hypothetical protein
MLLLRDVREISQTTWESDISPASAWFHRYFIVEKRGNVSWL